jgi:hypothetical protein
MVDDKNERRPQDSSRVNINEEYEVQYWTNKFGISRDKLISTVKRVGVSVEDIKKSLNR